MECENCSGCDGEGEVPVAMTDDLSGPLCFFSVKNILSPSAHSRCSEARQKLVIAYSACCTDIVSEVSCPISCCFSIYLDAEMTGPYSRHPSQL